MDSVPLLVRVAVNDWTLRDGTAVRAGQQMLLHAGFYHRDREVFGAGADRFDPASRDQDDVSGTESVTQSNPPLYIFSRHRQSCAGQFLVMFLLKATLASLLTRVNVTLAEQLLATRVGSRRYRPLSPPLHDCVRPMIDGRVSGS